jgi:hypothetical protein
LSDAQSSLSILLSAVFLFSQNWKVTFVLYLSFLLSFLRSASLSREPFPHFAPGYLIIMAFCIAWGGIDHFGACSRFALHLHGSSGFCSWAVSMIHIHNLFVLFCSALLYSILLCSAFALLSSLTACGAGNKYHGRLWTGTVDGCL